VGMNRIQPRRMYFRLRSVSCVKGEPGKD